MSTWYQEAVFYHIYPLGMTGALTESKEGRTQHRIRQISLWIEYIKSMGFTAIYIGPLFESTTHGYDTSDYKQIDHRLGDNEDFVNLVRQCHEAGIKVVVDGVFNHTGRDFFAFQDIQKNREASLYKDWYQGIRFDGNTPYNDGFGYEAWRNCYELVNLNLRHPAVKNYLFEVVEEWIQNFDIDGIRLDCADVLDFDFMRELRYRTGQKKADFWLMGEVIHGDYSRWIKDDMLHSVTNYELHKALYSGHNEHNYFEIAHSIRRLFDEDSGICRGKKLYSFVDNHDVDRIASKLTRRENLYPVYALLYTLPGIPSIYYGSEWGIEGKRENNRDDALRPVISREQGIELHNVLSDYIMFLGRIHRENSELITGRYQELLLTNRQYVFARRFEQSAVVTLVNNDEQAATVQVPAFMQMNQVLDLENNIELRIEADQRCYVEIPANSARILKFVSEHGKE